MAVVPNFLAQGLVSWKTNFSQVGVGVAEVVQEVMGAMESDGEWQMKLCLLLTSCHVVRFLTGHGLVLVQGLGVGDP